MLQNIVLMLIPSIANQNNLDMIQTLFILNLAPYRSHSLKTSLR
jgi:hypothetical protein